MAATEVTGQICDGPVAKKFPEGMLYTTIYQTPGFYNKMNNFSSVCLTIIGKQVLQTCTQLGSVTGMTNAFPSIE